MRICSTESMCPFSKTSSSRHGPGPKRRWKPAWGWNRDFESLFSHRGTSQKLTEESFSGHRQKHPIERGNCPGACASETEQLDYLRDRSTHRSGASQRRLLGEAHRRCRTEFSGASRQRNDTPFQVRNSVEKRVCRSAKEESKPRFPKGSASRIRAHNHLHFTCTSS